MPGMSQSSRTRFYDTKSESICPKLEAAMKQNLKNFDATNHSQIVLENIVFRLILHKGREGRKNFDEHSISGRRTTKRTSGN